MQAEVDCSPSSSPSRHITAALFGAKTHAWAQRGTSSHWRSPPPTISIIHSTSLSRIRTGSWSWCKGGPRVWYSDTLSTLRAGDRRSLWYAKTTKLLLKRRMKAQERLAVERIWAINRLWEKPVTLGKQSNAEADDSHSPGCSQHANHDAAWERVKLKSITLSERRKTQLSYICNYLKVARGNFRSTGSGKQKPGSFKQQNCITASEAGWRVQGISGRICTQPIKASKVHTTFFSLRFNRAYKCTGERRTCTST